jgi:hypothetical protein
MFKTQRVAELVHDFRQYARAKERLVGVSREPGDRNHAGPACHVSHAEYEVKSVSEEISVRECEHVRRTVRTRQLEQRACSVLVADRRVGKLRQRKRCRNHYCNAAPSEVLSERLNDAARHSFEGQDDQFTDGNHRLFIPRGRPIVAYVPSMRSTVLVKNVQAHAGPILD